MYVACCLYVCMCVCVAVYVCMLLVLCKQVCWRRAPHLDKASLFPACALFANTNPAPLEGHPRVKIKPRHTPSHWSASQQTFPREWSWSLRLRIQQGSGGVREMRGRGALQKTTPMNSEAAVAILASDSLAQVAVSCQHSQGLLDHRGFLSMMRRYRCTISRATGVRPTHIDIFRCNSSCHDRRLHRNRGAGGPCNCSRCITGMLCAPHPQCALPLSPCAYASYTKHLRFDTTHIYYNASEISGDT